MDSSATVARNTLYILSIYRIYYDHGEFYLNFFIISNLYLSFFCFLVLNRLQSTLINHFYYIMTLFYLQVC